MVLQKNRIRLCTRGDADLQGMPRSPVDIRATTTASVTAAHRKSWARLRLEEGLRMHLHRGGGGVQARGRVLLPGVIHSLHGLLF
jgi:hypothetical protein